MSPRRRLLSRLSLAFGVPLLLLALAEGGARWLPESEPAGIWHDPYFRPLLRPGADGGLVPVQDAEGHALWSNDRAMAERAGDPAVGRRFVSREKAAGVTRVFCFGGSSTYGLPLSPHLSFSRLLEARLRRLLPARRLEVVNAGISGYDSHDLPRVARESLAFSPDVWIVYAGHNELKYPNLSRVKHPWFTALLEHSSLVRRLVPTGAPPPMPGLIEDQPFLSPAAFARSLDRYRGALAEIVGLARAHGVQVVLCTPASNVRDKEPRLTVLGQGSGAEREARREQLRELNARYGVSLRPGPMPTVDPAQRTTDSLTLAELLRAEPEAALAHFLTARVALLDDDTVAAAAAFRRSQECDGLPERATPAMVDAVRALAAEHGVVLADTEGHLVQHCASVAPGFDLFVDYCHPNVAGDWWLADAILRALAEHDVVAPAAEYQWSREGEDDLLRFYLDELQFREEALVDGKVEGAMARLGQALEQVERREDLLAIAEEWLRGVLRLAPGHARAHVLMGVAAALRGDRQAAWTWIAEGQRLDPEEARVLSQRIAAHPLLKQTLAGMSVEASDGGFRLVERRP